MKFIDKQALNLTLVDGENTYIATEKTQIRAFTVFNPTTSNISLSVKIGGKQYITKTITPNTTEVIGKIFNQQLSQSDALSVSGAGLNALVTVVEIIE